MGRPYKQKVPPSSAQEGMGVAPYIGVASPAKVTTDPFATNRCCRVS